MGSSMGDGNGLWKEADPISSLSWGYRRGIERKVGESGPERLLMGVCSPEGPKSGIGDEVDETIGRSIINMANMPIRGP